MPRRHPPLESDQALLLELTRALTDATADVDDVEEMRTRLADDPRAIALMGEHAALLRAPRVTSTDTPLLDAVEHHVFPETEEPQYTGEQLRAFRRLRMAYQLTRHLCGDELAATYEHLRIGYAIGRLAGTWAPCGRTEWLLTLLDPRSHAPEHVH